MITIAPDRFLLKNQPMKIVHRTLMAGRARAIGSSRFTEIRPPDFATRADLVLAGRVTSRSRGSPAIRDKLAK